MNVNCKEFQHQITLSLYDELNEGALRDLELHMQECGDCKQTFETEKAMHSTLAEDTASWDVPADLLVESRRALANELDRIEKKQSWWRMPAFSVVFTPMRLLESGALIAMGLALGVYIGNHPAQPLAGPIAENAVSSIPQDGTISNLQVIHADPSTGQVEMVGEVSKPLRFQGRIDDDTVRRLLFSALRDVNNPGSRLKAVEVLSHKPTDESVEEALISALIYDDDANVRMRALESLKTFANEQHVQVALMHTLQNDMNAGIRLEAINALMTHNPKDSSLAEKMREATKEDDNPYIRSRVLQFVGTAK
jgi:hypothetical protein